MNKGILKNLIIVFGVVLTSLFYLASMNDLSYAQDVQDTGGLKFQVPDDWPIEKRGGIVGPIPTDEYVSMKFKKSNAQFEVMKVEFSEKMDALKASLDGMEKSFSDQIKQTDTEGNLVGGAGVYLTDILARLAEVENQLARLDRKITNKAAAMKAETGDKFVQINSFDKKISNLNKKVKKLDKEVEYLFTNKGE